MSHVDVLFAYTRKRALKPADVMQNYLSYTVTVSEQRPQAGKQRGTTKTAAVVKLRLNVQRSALTGIF